MIKILFWHTNNKFGWFIYGYRIFLLPVYTHYTKMKRLEDKIERSTLQGAVFPINLEKKFQSIIGDGVAWIPVFSTKEKFQEAAKWCGFKECQEIVDYRAFFATMIEAKKKLNFHLILDPHLVDGKLRFQLIPLDESDISAIVAS